jgi:hypothetical protein
MRSNEKDFETLQLGAFATPGLLLTQGPASLTAQSGFKNSYLSSDVQKAHLVALSGTLDKQ